MAEPFAVSTDVAERWRTLTEDEAAVADRLAADASDMVRERWADVDARIAAGSLSLDSVRRVVAYMVKRAMINANAEGLESRAQTAGPFSVNDKFANPTGALYFTAADVLVFEPEGSTVVAATRWLA